MAVRSKRGAMRDAMARGEMPFLDHLEELRERIFKAGGAVLIAAVIGFVLVMKLKVMDILLAPWRELVDEISAGGADWLGAAETGRLMFLSPTEPFFFMLKLGLITGLILASPIVIYQIWAFLAPALEAHERKVIVPSLYLGLVLFAGGVAMGYFVALPVTLRFLIMFGQEYFSPMITGAYYLSFVVRLLLAFGIVFELPVVIMILSAMGLVTPRFLREKRRHAIVLITILASFISPGDVIAVTLLLMIPLILLYEFSILLSVVIYRRKEEPSIQGSAEAPEGTVEMGG